MAEELDNLEERLPASIRLAVFMESIPDIHKDKTVNTGKFSYDYVSLDSILALIKPLLTVSRLSLVQPIQYNELGAEVLHTRIVDIYTGITVLGSSMLLTNGLDPQKKGSEISYYRRYSITSMLALGVGDGDDDGAAATKSVRSSNAAQPVSQNMISDSIFIQLDYNDVTGRGKAKEGGAKWDPTAKKWAMLDTPGNRTFALTVSDSVYDKNGNTI